MANKNKAKGTRGETKVVNFLKSRGYPAYRKALTGAQDEGDVAIEGKNTVIEVKSGKQTYNPSRGQLEEWLRQAWVERNNACKKDTERKDFAGHCDDPAAILIVVRHNRKIEDADVWRQYFDGDGYFTRSHHFLDEWA